LSELKEALAEKEKAIEKYNIDRETLSNKLDEVNQ
jgi:hypothetical protein